MPRKTDLLFFLIALTAGMILHDAHAQSSSSRTETLPQKFGCNDASYRFLPGAFNYCLARKLWNKEKYEDAEQMLLLAAGWGSKPAQHMLGLAYLNGAGLAKDRPLGLAWLRLAAERKDPAYASALRIANAAASPAELITANALYQQLLTQYRDDIAAARANRRFNREVHAVSGNPVHNPGVCIIGLNAQYVQNPDPNAGGPNCPPAELTVKLLEAMAEPYFEGWKGKVEVGPLEQADKPDPQTSPNVPVSP